MTTLAGEGAPEGKAPPKSFDYYVEGAKWLVIVASAVLAFGFDAVKEHAKGWAFLAFCGSALLLALAIVCGVMYLWLSYSFAALREAGTAPDDEEAEGIRRRKTKWFNRLRWTFALGMFAYAGFGATLLWEIRRAKPEFALTEMSSPTGSVVVAEHEGHFWALERTPKGYQWSKEIPGPTPE